MTFRVVLGDHNLSQNDGTEQYISVQKIVVHPSWNSNNVAAGSGKVALAQGWEVEGWLPSHRIWAFFTFIQEDFEN